jgi:hypothetical protein
MKTKTHLAICYCSKVALILSPNKRESGGDAKPKKLRLQFYSLTFEIGLLLLCPEPR